MFLETAVCGFPMAPFRSRLPSYFPRTAWTANLYVMSMRRNQSVPNSNSRQVWQVPISFSQSNRRCRKAWCVHVHTRRSLCRAPTPKGLPPYRKHQAALYGGDMAEVILPSLLCLTTTKTVLFIDAVFLPGGGLIAHAAQVIQSQASQAPAKSTDISLRQRSKGPTGASNSRVRQREKHRTV